MTFLQLTCPSCGNGQALAQEDIRFGKEVRCEQCSKVSLITKDNDLRLRSELEASNKQVCPSCGEVVSVKARFCQNRHALMRPCLNCEKEISISHNICEHCGWQQNDALNSKKGIEERLKRAMNALTDKDSEVRQQACNELVSLGENALPSTPNR